MAKKADKTPSEMDIHELDARIEELNNEMNALHAARHERIQEGRHALAADVRELINNAGYALDDIVPLLIPKRRTRSASRAGRGNVNNYPRYIDPANPANVYIRGVLPHWFKEQMQANGFDPSVKADREAFKANHLHREEPA